MVSSASLMAMLGLGASFLPQEALSYAGYQAEGMSVLLVQVTGALYFSYALLNWMARGVLIGGIYSRPVALGNFTHFFIVTIVLAKALLVHVAPPILIGAAIYFIFALWFGLVLFTHPDYSPNAAS